MWRSNSLHPERAEQPGARDRFDVEARAAARLVHPNVVTVYDFGEEGDLAFLVMERLPGRTLRDELADGPLAVERACELAVEILAALEAAHDAGILHRDVKPGNVLLTEDGHAKVSDFGIAKLAEGADHTMTTELLATPVYLAPERFHGAPASRRTDLYAVGVVLYEVLAGRRPFEGPSAAEVYDAMRRGAATPLADVRPDVPPAVAAAVTRAMDPDPDRRFASAADMAAALGVEGGDPTVAVDGGVPTVAVDPTIAVVDPRGTATIAVEPATPPTRRSDPSPPPAAVKRQKVAGSVAGRRVAAAVVGALLLVAVVVGLVLALDDGSPTDPGATTATTAVSAPAAAPAGPELPAPLEESVDELERLTTR